MAARRPELLPRLPRAVYWIAGAAIAFTGAIAARVLADRVSGDYRIAIWLAGGALIFLGVAVLSMGTHWRLNDSNEETGVDNQKNEQQR